MKLLFGLILLLPLLSACKIPDVEPEAAFRPQSKPQILTDTKTYFAFECDESSLPNSKFLIKSANILRTAGRKSICVDVTRTHALSDRIVRIKPRSRDEVYIELPCKNVDNFASSLSSTKNAGSIVLVANGVALASYRYLEKTTLADRCGVFLSNSVDEAVEICADVLRLRQEASTACMALCDEEKPESMKDVCVVANATF